ncbi:hypothetical protein SAMN04488100_11427 [Alkalibacterium putridalgicola]|uniref:Uncharacterized protein n=2 Tax=Alkalibacterium putridalgicola TaxID=426703 RepID=A0A1H7TV69_9LACT|nr:hypothetical protein SAMN04488100_11427 [Alkalibacterium putridalgicola]
MWLSRGDEAFIMTMKLRIPILFAILSVTAAVYESLPGLFLSTDNYFLYSSQYILTIISLFYLLEKMKFNEKEVKLSSGMIIVAATVMFELFI